MVCLNESIMFNKLKLKKNLIKKVTDDVNNNFYLYNLNQIKIDSNIRSELTMSIVVNVNKIIKESIKNLFSSDNFIYLNMDNQYCVHKYIRGKKEGYICHNKIRTNLNGEKEDYLCVRHSKKHIPQKRISKNKKSVDKIIPKKESINDDNHIIKINNKNKIKKKTKKNNKKIILCNGIIDFKEIIKELLT